MAGSICTDGRRRGHARADAQGAAPDTAGGSATPNPSDGGFAAGAAHDWTPTGK
jgi:hypothetical protein